MKKVTRFDAIIALNEKFFGNNPESWSQNSDQELAEYYAEHILKDKTLAIEVQDGCYYFFQSIEYNGRKFPIRTLTMTSEDTDEMTVTIADETLSKAMQENSPHFKAPVERAIDESIYFYVEAGDLYLPAETICKAFLDEEFEFIEE